MNINNATICNNYTLARKSDLMSYVAEYRKKQAQAAASNEDDAVVVSLSKETQKFLDVLNPDRDFFELDLSNFSKDVRETMLLNMPEREEVWLPTSIPSSETIRQSLLFATDTIERCVFDALEDKVGKDTAYQFSHLLSDMIFNNKDKNIDERVAIRQSAASLAECLAQEYMNEEDTKEFLGMIDTFTGQAELLDQGYIVINSLSRGVVFKPNKTNPVYDYAAKYCGYTLNDRGVVEELSDDNKKYSTVYRAFISDAQNGSTRWLKALEACKKRDEDFYNNAKSIQDSIDEAKKANIVFQFDADSFAIINDKVSSMKYAQSVSWEELSKLLQ